MREVWLQAHLKQPLGSRDGSRNRQRGGSGLKSTTGGSRGGSSAMARAGGVLHQRVNKRPHRIPGNSSTDSLCKLLSASFHLWSILRGNGAHTPIQDLESYESILPKSLMSGCLSWVTVENLCERSKV